MTMTNISLEAIQVEVIAYLTSNANYIAVGSGTTTPDVTDTTLTTETYRDALYSESSALNVYIAELFLDTTENNGNDIAECGLFNTVSAGTMYQKALTNIIPKNVNTEVFLTISITVNALGA